MARPVYTGMFVSGHVTKILAIRFPFPSSGEKPL